MKLVAWIVTIVLSLFFCVSACVREVEFDRGCGGHLKRAADANTIVMAHSELKTAVDYARAHNLDRGYTSIFYETPDEDIGYWFKNLESAQAELEALPPSVSPLERSNMLIKLRETLLDQGEHTSVTLPSGISRYPNNGFYAGWAVISLLLLLAVGTWTLIELD